MSQALMGLAQLAAWVRQGPEMDWEWVWGVGGGIQEGRKIRNEDRRPRFLVDFCFFYFSLGFTDIHIFPSESPSP